MKRVFVQDGKIYCKDCTLIFLKDGKLFAMDSEENWITTENGSHIKIDENGTVIGGAGGKLNGKSFSKPSSTPTETTVKIPAVKTDMFEDYDKAEKEIEARENAWKKVLSNPKFDAAEWKDASGMTYVISRSIKDGEWQLSYFNREGDALGDKQANNPVEFLDKVSQGDDSQDVTVVYQEE